MDHLDAEAHTRGRSRYVDDEPRPAGLLQAAVVPSPVAHGEIRSLDLTAVRDYAGVVAVLTAEDIPGSNQIGSVLPDEPLLSTGEVHYIGQPIALVVAEDFHAARHAVARARLDIDERPVVVDPKEAFERGHLIADPQSVHMGDVDAAWAQCDVVVEGEATISGQEHVYLETQRARALPEENGAIRVLSSTQSPYVGQRTIAGILGVPLHQIEVDVRRLGGGFGGKEDQATPWACFAALAAHHTGRPVEIVLSRAEDLLMTGKRHAYRSDYKIGVTRDGRILALDVRHFQNSGAACDLSLAVLGRTLFHTTNSYFIPNVRVWGAPCRTNIPPATAFRGFGGPQGMFAVESALTHAAEALGIDREELQRRNLLRSSDSFPYGQNAATVRIRRCWEELDEGFDLEATRQQVEEWNDRHPAVKKGYAVMPVTFGISFTATFLNQASALLHVYTDGSVSLSTGGVEMGQGLFSNLAVVASRALGIEPTRVRVESTNTRRIANMSASAASSTTLLNGNATLRAATPLRERLLTHAGERLGSDPSLLTIENEQLLCDGEPTGWDWPKLVKSAYLHRVSLSAHGFYATPEIHYDEARGRGHPFAYHVCGAALVEVTVDGLRGSYEIDRVRLVHDLGRPLNRRVDLGQVEGGLAQGLGWMTVEDLRYDETGRNLSAALATYKVPDVYLMPRDLEVRFIEEPDTEAGPYHAKAVGEPPLMYGLGVVFALRRALRAFGRDGQLPFVAPMTPEQVLLQLQGDDDPSRLVSKSLGTRVPVPAEAVSS
ncbi:MAG: molybdopterin-dependent oxidoreductase [Thermoanaerobaculia bacterium]|nr:molybdopterin-dependent oxidoreductase [Thermoanaerobaculia bacterium]